MAFGMSPFPLRFGARQGGGAAPVQPYALNFDGADDYASAGRVATSEPGTGDFTYAVRAKFDTTTGYPTLIANSDGATYRINLLYLSGSLYGQVAAGGAATNKTASFTPSGWHNLAFTRRSGASHLYIDGTESADLGSIAGDIADAGMRLQLGSYNEGADADGNFDGQIAKAAIWVGSNMSEAQLDAWFASDNVTTNSPTHAWAINEGADSTLNDAVGSADMTIYGATWVEI